jgi:hypothetical protein
MRLLVVKTELYEMSPPPGNNGGAVSGEAPWLQAEEAQSNRMGASHTHTHARLFVECTFPPEKAAA